MIFRINKNRVIRASRHAGFTADADRFVEVDDAVSTLEHRRRWAGDDARCVCTLIAARDLVRAPRLWKDADVDVLNVSAGDADGHDVFRLACGRAGVTADAAGVVDDLRPLNALVASWLLIDHVAQAKSWRTITCKLAAFTK